jgi:hypothetical protein
MLSPADARLVSRDERVPGLGTLLEASAFARVLEGVIPERRVKRARGTYIRYKPGTSCLVGYEVTVEGESAAEERISLYARAHADDGEKIGKAGERRGGEEGRGGSGIYALNDPPLVIFLFPHDHELPVLSRLVSPDLGAGLLAKAVRGAEFGRDDRRLVPLRYKPERRFVAQARMRDGTPLLVKAVSTEEAPACVARARAFQSRGGLRIARFLGAYERRGILAWEWIEGSPVRLTGAPAQEANSTGSVIGEALAQLHTQPADLPVLYGGRALESVISSAAAAVGIVSEHGARAERIAAKVARAALRWPAADVPVHGDLSVSQVILPRERGGAALIDLDRAGLGAAPFDLGTFAANLEYLVMLGEASPQCACATAAGLLEGYCKNGGEEVRSQMRPATALGLLKLAVEPFRVRHAEWDRLLEACLARAEALLEGE